MLAIKAITREAIDINNVVSKQVFPETKLAIEMQGKVTQAIEKFKNTGDPKDMPFTQLALKNSEGKFGKKVGEGWYKYQ